MRRSMNNTANSSNNNNKKKGNLAGKIAVLCTAVMLAAGGVYTWKENTTNVPELTSFVDHEGETVIIGGEEVPLGGEPKVTKDTKKSKKTVTLKKPAKKTRTKKSTKTKESTDTEKNGSNVIVTKTTVVTVKKQKFKKDSMRKVIITKVTTTTETSVQAGKDAQAQAVSQDGQEVTAGARTVDIKTLAPKLNSAVMDAYTMLGFTVTIDPSVSYSGYFNARNQAIILQKEGDTIYHEVGHFLAFVAGNVDKGTDFAAIYNEEKGKYTGTNKNYVTQNASEYFAESFKDYTLSPSALQQSRPKTYQAIVDALAKVTTQQINKIKLAYGPIWK